MAAALAATHEAVTTAMLRAHAQLDLMSSDDTWNDEAQRESLERLVVIRKAVETQLDDLLVLSMEIGARARRYKDAL